MTELLSRTPGNFAVILHSEPDCATLVERGARAADPSRFFCTNLTETEIIRGGGEAVLRDAVEGVLRNRRPDAVFLLGSCVSSIIADDMERVAAGFTKRKAAVIALPMQAFRLYGQAEIINLHTDLMSRIESGEAVAKGRAGDRSINLFGFPDDGGGVPGLFEHIGIRVNAAPQISSPADGWKGLHGAALNVTTDGRLFKNVLCRLETECGISAVESAPPAGAAATERLLNAVAGHFGMERNAGPAVFRLSAEARRGLERFRKKHRGRRLAYHIGARKSFELETTVRDGLLFAELFPEMGFDVELLFQGPVESEARARIAAVLDRYRVALPFRPLPDRPSLTGMIKERGYELIYCCDSLKDEVDRGGIKMLPFGSMKTGFDGVLHNIRFMEKALGKK
jgi:nitrogenase molybdenum-iron protein alpha/beta subunit